MNELKNYKGTCYRLTGKSAEKPLLVLIHGVGLNQDLWLPWLSILKVDFRLLTYDLLGHGGSHNPPGPRSVADFVGQLCEILDHIEAPRVALAGFSLGALISQGFASMYAPRLTHLVLLHSVYMRTEGQCQAVRARYEITRAQGSMATIEIAIQRWFSENYRDANPDKMDELRKIFSRHTDDGYLKAYYLFCHAEPEMQNYRLDQVRCPTLVITGSDDVGSTSAMSEALARDIFNAKLIVNQGHRHMAPMEHATMVANQVKSFLNR